VLVCPIIREAISDRKKYENKKDENNKTMEFKLSSIVTRALCSIRSIMPFDTINNARSTKFS
jgi:hypothetical protein